MFRRIGLTLLVVCVCAILPGATLFAGITNGTFQGYDSDPLNCWIPWDFPSAAITDQLIPAGLTGAKMYETEDGMTYLSQSFNIEHGYGILQFDLKFEHIGGGDTEFFFVSLSDSGTPVSGSLSHNDTVIPEDDKLPQNIYYSYRVGSDGTIAHALGVEHPEPEFLGEWGRVLIPVSDLWVNPTVWFGITSIDYNVAATAMIDNVAIVPEPATMTLGLIGVAVVGAVRRRMR
jgi:hypothetical protein